MMSRFFKLNTARDAIGFALSSDPEEVAQLHESVALVLFHDVHQVLASIQNAVVHLVLFREGTIGKIRAAKLPRQVWCVHKRSIVRWRT